jgi:hypothetical protein
MATRTIDIKNYCDSLYSELFNMKTRLVEFVTQIEHMEGKEKFMINPFVRHLNELINTIDWKLEIFTKACPVDWSKYIRGVESTVSVSTETTRESEPAGGYVGG